MAGLPAGALLLASVAAAQPDTEEGAQPTQLEEVNVVGRRAFEDRFLSNATRLTISRRDIEAMGANSIGDILRQTPGLQVTTTANGGIEIRMRGMGPENTRILIDGVPVSASNRNVQLPMDELPADLIERIEVIRAPTAEFQGAAGGTLNIVLREASAKKETYLWLTDQYVWNKHGPSLFVSQTGPLGARPPKPAAGGIPESSWTYFVSFSGGERNLGSDTKRQSSVNTAAPTTANIDDESRLRNAFWILRPRVTGRLGASDRVTFRGVFSGSDRNGRVLSELSGLSNGTALTSATQNPWQYNRTHGQGAVDWSHSFKDAKWDSTLQLDYPQSEYRFDRYTATTLAGVATTRTSAYSEDRTEHGYIAKTKLAMAVGESVWTMGGEFDSRKLDVGSASTMAGVATPLNLDASTRRTALWGQDEVTIESIKTALTVGLRAQDFSTDVATAGSSTSFSKLGWQPSINTRTALSENTQYRFNIARISRNPRIWELAPLTEPSFTTNSPTAPDFRGNPDLRPESTLTLDTGIERRLAIGGQAGINVFVRRQSDVIRRRLFLVGTRWTEQPDNIGSALVWGIETDIRTNLAWAGLGRGWKLTANANLLNSRLTGDTLSGERLPGQARYLANLNIAKPLRVSGGWYGGGTLALTGSSDSNFASTPTVLTTGGERAHAQLDMYIGSVIPKLAFWRLNVYNITDFRRDRTRVVTDTMNGTVTSEHSERWLTPRWFLTVGTRF